MNEITLNNQTLPVVIETGFFGASEPFYHMRRTAKFNVLIYVTKGVIYVTENNIEYEIRPGSFLILKSNLLHFGQHEIPRGTQWYYIHFYSQNVPSSIKYKSMQIKIPKFMTGLTDSSIENHIAKIVEDFHSEKEETLWNINRQLFDLLVELNQEVKSPEKKLTLSGKICTYLEDNQSLPFDAERLSAFFCLSYKRLASVFKSEMGISMQQYDCNLKMQKAKQLLRTTDFSINQIASECGYEDSLYFSRYFKQKTGLCPKDFRKKSSSY